MFQKIRPDYFIDLNNEVNLCHLAVTCLKQLS